MFLSRPQAEDAFFVYETEEIAQEDHLNQLKPALLLYSRRNSIVWSVY